MIKAFVTILTLIILSNIGFAQNFKDSVEVYKRLDEVMKNHSFYINKREERIKVLKNEAQLLKNDSILYLKKNYQIFESYKKFQSDSALTYILLCQRLAKGDTDSLRYGIDLDLAWIYSSVGKYIEAEKLLKQIKSTEIPTHLKPQYYDTYSSFYSHYGQSNNQQEYYQASELYRDSLLMVLPTHSKAYQISYAIKVLFRGDRKKAKNLLESLLIDHQDKLEQKAVITYFIGLIYKYEQNISAQHYYFAQSAIADMLIANRDNASLQDLALTYYDEGDFDRAFHFIEKAIDDAVNCNVRYRVVEGTSFYPIINSSYQKKINEQNKELIVLVVLISILLFGLLSGLIIIYRQVQRLRKIRIELSETNRRLTQLNHELNLTNIQLSESDHIKEEYIAQFFDMCSSYIDKMEDIRKALLKKASTEQWDSMKEQLKSTQMVEREVKQLYINFDSIFLNLYPTFVQDFNLLLLDDEKINPKKDELLNTELRIFALIRLGIRDSVKIASFLRYSLRTVYNYRTKLRNKAIGNRDDFEERVRDIGVVNRK